MTIASKQTIWNVQHEHWLSNVVSEAKAHLHLITHTHMHNINALVITLGNTDLQNYDKWQLIIAIKRRKFWF